ncbi:MAG: COX15/CtaA family protein [Deltaproteobacteria bacterium]
MLEFRLAQATAIATFALLVIGGMVHATGSSLACPDWPLCYGQFFPAMEGGVLFEHGHRLVALAVSVLTLALAVTVWRRRRETAVRVGSLVALGLVLFQASLGALTVVWKLPLVVSSGHLATSMAFFSVLVWLAWRLAPASEGVVDAPAPGGVRALAGAAALATYLQIVLGALVRHTGSGLACGTTVVLCEGAAWPVGGPAQLVTLHRYAGVVVALLVLAAAFSALRSGPSRARGAARVAPVLVVVQVLLGAWTVWSMISVGVVSLHLAGGALLLADSLLLFLLLGPRPVAQRTARDRVPGLVPAAG